MRVHKNMSVIVYTTPTCSWCKTAKAFLQERGVAFEEIDVTQDQVGLQEMLEKSEQMGVPVIDINGTIIVGFNQLRIEHALAGTI